MIRAVCLLLSFAGCAQAIELAITDATILTMRRVYVEPFGGGETAGQLRDMLISALQSTRMVQITENQERADVVLKGSGEDLVYSEDHSSSDNLNFHANASSSGTSTKGSDSSGLGAGENESSRSSERKHESFSVGEVGESGRRCNLVGNEGKPRREISRSQRRCGRQDRETTGSRHFSG